MTNGKTVAIYFGHPKLHQLTSAQCKNLPTFGSHLLLTRSRLREILFRFMNECVIKFVMCMYVVICNVWETRKLTLIHFCKDALIFAFFSRVTIGLEPF